jgi:hypothetical protein
MKYDARAVIVGDVHVPNQDKKTLDVFNKILRYLVERDTGKLELIIGGDFLDCYDISTFPKTENKEFADEIEEGHRVLANWRKILGKRKITYVTGNHEFRLRKYLVNEAPALHNVMPSVDELLRLKELDIKWVDLPEHLSSFKDVYTDWHGVLIGHFNKYNRNSAYTAKALVDDKGVSIVQGHTHRAGVFFKENYKRHLFGIENGCMCRIDKTHEVNPNWQHACTVLTLKNGTIYPELIKIENYRAVYGGKMFL